MLMFGEETKINYCTLQSVFRVESWSIIQFDETRPLRLLLAKSVSREGLPCLLFLQLITWWWLLVINTVLGDGGGEGWN